MRLWYWVVADTFVQWIRERAILCNSHMNARSTLTRRRTIQMITTLLLAPFVASRGEQRKRRLPVHHVVQNRGAQRWA
jgi:hypothetical protein